MPSKSHLAHLLAGKDAFHLDAQNCGHVNAYIKSLTSPVILHSLSHLYRGKELLWRKCFKFHHCIFHRVHLQTWQPCPESVSCSSWQQVYGYLKDQYPYGNHQRKKKKKKEGIGNSEAKEYVEAVILIVSYNLLSYTSCMYLKLKTLSTIRKFQTSLFGHVNAYIKSLTSPVILHSLSHLYRGKELLWRKCFKFFAFSIAGRSSVFFRHSKPKIEPVLFNYQQFFLMRWAYWKQIARGIQKCHLNFSRSDGSSWSKPCFAFLINVPN